MPLSRRNFLRIVGSSAIILPATACTTSTDSARQPWQNAGQYQDPMRRALSYALLAPNPHNRQPWVVNLHGGDSANLYVDLGHLLPETDPYSRQITIGLGCFLEQFRMAAQAFGFQAEVLPFPDGYNDRNLDTRPVAHLRLTPGGQPAPSPEFSLITRRRTNRNLYQDRTPVHLALKAITRGLGNHVTSAFTNNTDRVALLQELAVTASNIEFDTPRTYRESVDVMRIGAKEIKANPDGLALEGPMLETLHTLGMLNRKSLANPHSAMFRAGRDGYAKGIKSARAFVWLSTPTNTRLDQIRAGAAYVRLNLKATGAGMAMHPLSQALQEYAEMKQSLKRIHQLLDVKDGARVQMFARVGYAKSVAPAPRWPLEAKIRPV
ncbi:MAG: hypothetical protein Q9M33_02165 [Robiginitomaculum sp.]|nr:hypothetical protein [Robiginitomaculum sp.]MDQ7078103.1 hypothetical protein [Robiginitomaculum sp.]